MTTEVTKLSRNQIVNELLKIGHGDLSIYNQTGLDAVSHEDELFGHLIAWNDKKGEVRDSKVAFPVLAMRGRFDAELFENAAAHLCKLDARNLLRACYYHRELNKTQKATKGGAGYIKVAVQKFLKERENNKKWWDATALQHRESMKGLYALYHIAPSEYANNILFKRLYPANSVFARLAELKNMKPEEAAGTILNYNIPFLIAVGALGGIKGKTDIVLSLIEKMSGNELINNTNMLQKCGVFENNTLKAAYEAAVSRMQKDKRKVSTLKASKAAEAISKANPESKKAIERLQQVQEERLQKLGGIDGDWLVLGDRSGSMHSAIQVAQTVAGLIAQQVKGNVYLIFFNNSPTYFDVTNKTLEEIGEMTKRVRASGSTSIGCGLEYLTQQMKIVQGIVIASDGGDNHFPLFHVAYKKYVQTLNIEPTVYLFHTYGDNDVLSHNCRVSQIPVEKFELGNRVDYYALPNLVKTLRTNRYSLVDEILETPLLTFADVYKQKTFKREAV